MARPIKAGLDYFPVDVDIFEDDKLYDVQLEYGPLGEVIYLRLLCLIYKNGYFYRFDSLDKLAGMLIKSIGNRWVRNKQAIIDVILFLAKINLFSAELMRENVITSRSIQSRFQKANERNHRQIEQYNLLENSDSREGLITVPQNSVNVTETAVIAAETGVSVYNNPPKERKEKEIKIKERKVKERKEECSADALPSPSPSSPNSSFSFAADAAADYADANLAGAYGDNAIVVNNSYANDFQGSANKKSASASSANRAPQKPQKNLREELIKQYGENNIIDYEERYQRWLASKGRAGNVNYNTIARWLKEDGIKPSTHSADTLSSFDVDEVMRQVMKRYEQ